MSEGRGFVPTNRKIVSLAEAARMLSEWRASGRAAAYTNGCFDLMHAGHVRTLESARAQADVLVVGVNSDDSTRRIKGEGRPILPEQDRAELIAALACVDLVVVFGDETSLGVLQALRPEVWVKGGDYSLDTVNQEERAYVESYGGRVVLGPPVPSVSTTDIIARIRDLSND
jgi:D-beta-D-heptose 7-phosphate kinase/D-beta-D-heptose 1-phosphate adenosyltransferase